MSETPQLSCPRCRPLVTDRRLPTPARGALAAPITNKYGDEGAPLEGGSSRVDTHRGSYPGRSAYLRRCGARSPVVGSDSSYRHVMDVLWPIESCRRALSSWVGCAKITHMKRAASTTRTIEPHQNASEWPRNAHALGTNTFFAPGPRTWTIVSAVAVIAHGQRRLRATPRPAARSAITRPDVSPVIMPSMR